MPVVANVVFKYPIPAKNITIYKQSLNNFYNILDTLGNNIERKIRADLMFKYRFEKEKFEPRYYRIEPKIFRDELSDFLDKMNDRIRRYREFRDDIIAIRDDMDYYRKVFLLI